MAEYTNPCNPCKFKLRLDDTACYQNHEVFAAIHGTQSTHTLPPPQIWDFQKKRKKVFRKAMTSVNHILLIHATCTSKILLHVLRQTTY